MAKKSKNTNFKFFFIVVICIILIPFLYKMYSQYQQDKIRETHMNACQSSFNKIAKWDTPRIAEFDKIKDNLYSVIVQFSNGFGGRKNEKFYCEVFCYSDSCKGNIIPGSTELLYRMYDEMK